MGLTIVCGNTKKGGVGKSTIATNLAVDLTKTGYKVNILDVDPENTASMDFINQREEPGISCKIINTPQELIDALEDTKDDFTIVDIGGLESDLTVIAIAIADVIFVPFRLSSKDLKALGSFIEYTKNLFEGEAAAPSIYLVPNFVHPNSDKIKITEDLQVLVDQGYKIGSILTNRQSYINSADYGQSVSEHGDNKAADEIDRLKRVAIKELRRQK